MACTEIDSTDLRASEPNAQPHARADSGVSAGRNARAREVLSIFPRLLCARSTGLAVLSGGGSPSLRHADTVGIPSACRRPALGKQTKGEGLGSHESPLLTDQQARDASPDQLEDLVEQINLALRGLALRERGLPGLARDQQPGVVPGDPAPGESPENPASD